MWWLISGTLVSDMNMTKFEILEFILGARGSEPVVQFSRTKTSCGNIFQISHAQLTCKCRLLTEKRRRTDKAIAWQSASLLASAGQNHTLYIAVWVFTEFQFEIIPISLIFNTISLCLCWECRILSKAMLISHRKIWLLFPMRGTNKFHQILLKTGLRGFLRALITKTAVILTSDRFLTMNQHP